jgi:hypothetical protein
VSTLTRILLVAAIAVVALIGIGFGLCGVFGLTAVGFRGGNLSPIVLACSLAGIGIAVGAVLLIRTLSKTLRHKDRE